MYNTKIKVGIICPLDDEYDACKEILGLKNESELFGRVFSERKEENIEVYAIKAGVGKINCSSATQLVKERKGSGLESSVFYLLRFPNIWHVYKNSNQNRHFEKIDMFS